ncbi:unnamed protein product, partial [Rotaria magnacalcarata]
QLPQAVNCALNGINIYETVNLLIQNHDNKIRKLIF